MKPRDIVFDKRGFKYVIRQTIDEGMLFKCYRPFDRRVLILWKDELFPSPQEINRPKKVILIKHRRLMQEA